MFQRLEEVPNVAALSDGEANSTEGDRAVTPLVELEPSDESAIKAAGEEFYDQGTADASCNDNDIESEFENKECEDEEREKEEEEMEVEVDVRRDDDSSLEENEQPEIGDDASSHAECSEPEMVKPLRSSGRNKDFCSLKTQVPTQHERSDIAEQGVDIVALLKAPETVPMWEGLSLDELKSTRERMLSLLYTISECIKREESDSTPVQELSKELMRENKVVVSRSLTRLLVESFHPSSFSDLKDMFVFVKGMKGKEANKMGAALQDIHRLTHHGDILNSQEKLQSFLNSSVRFTTSWREEFISAMKKLLGAFIHLNSCEEIMDDFYPQLLLVARHETYYTVLLRAAHGNSVVPQSMFCLSPEWLAATHSCKCTLQRPTQPFSSDAMSASLSASKNRQSFPDCNSAPLRRPYIDSSMRWNPPRVRPRLPVGMSPRLFSCESSVDRNYHHAHLERVSETPLWQRRAADVGFRGQLPARPSSVLRSSVRSKCSATPTPVNGGRRSQFLRTRSGTTTALTRSASSVRQMDPAASHSGPCIRIGSKLVCGIPLKLQRTATLSPGLVGTVQNSSSKGVTGPQANIYTNANTRGKCTQLVLTPRG